VLNLLQTHEIDLLRSLSTIDNSIEQLKNPYCNKIPINTEITPELEIAKFSLREMQNIVNSSYDIPPTTTKNIKNYREYLESLETEWNQTNHPRNGSKMKKNSTRSTKKKNSFSDISNEENDMHVLSFDLQDISENSAVTNTTGMVMTVSDTTGPFCSKEYLIAKFWQIFQICKRIVSSNLFLLFLIVALSLGIGGILFFHWINPLVTNTRQLPVFAPRPTTPTATSKN